MKLKDRYYYLDRGDEAVVSILFLHELTGQLKSGDADVCDKLIKKKATRKRCHKAGQAQST
jgi:hypothetical protein